jgi:hypothetical protein
MFKSEFRDLVPIQDRKGPLSLIFCKYGKSCRIFRSSQPKEDEIAFQYLSWGGAPVDWFVKQGVILGGIPLQNWMLLAIAIILLSVLISWWTHK